MDTLNRANSPLKLDGFTLIELLVVLSIVGILLSLVGPLAIDSVEKANARTEVQTVRNWIKYLGNRAYMTDQAFSVNLDGNTIVATSSSGQKFSRNFDYLFFVPQRLAIHRNGLVSPKDVAISLAGREIKIQVNTWDDSDEE